MSTVSVIIPIYNLEDKLCRCLDSVLEQSYKELQVILINDGSSDSSGEICQKYAVKDKRILYIEKFNGGVSSARNCGLEHATGEFVMFVDGDDSVSSQFVERYVQNAINSQADIVIGGLTLCEADTLCEKSPRIGTYDKKAFLSILCKDGTEIYGYACNKLFHRNLLEKEKIRFNESMHSQEDLAFALRAYEAAERIACIDYCGYFYFHEPTNRMLPPEHLLGNQINLFEIANKAGANVAPLIPRFQRMLYTLLYHAESVESIKALEKIQIPAALSVNSLEKRLEIRWVIKLFIKKDYKMILTYFSGRKKLRYVLISLNLLKQ